MCVWVGSLPQGLSHIVTPLANLLDYRKLTVISLILEVFENKCYNVTWELTTALSTAGYLAAQTLVALVI